MDLSQPYITVDSFTQNRERLDQLDLALYYSVNVLAMQLDDHFFNDEQSNFPEVNRDMVCDLSIDIVRELEEFFRDQCLACPIQCYREPHRSMSDANRREFRRAARTDVVQHIDTLKFDLNRFVVEPSVRFFLTCYFPDLAGSVIHIEHLSAFIEDALVLLMTVEYAEQFQSPNEAADSEFNDIRFYDQIFQSGYNAIESGFNSEEEPWKPDSGESEDADYATWFLESLPDAPSQLMQTAFLTVIDDLMKCFGYRSLKQLTDLDTEQYLYTEYIRHVRIFPSHMIPMITTMTSHFFEWLRRQEGASQLLSDRKTTIYGAVNRCARIQSDYIRRYDIMRDVWHDPNRFVSGLFRIRSQKYVGFYRVESVRFRHKLILRVRNSGLNRELRPNDLIHCRMRKRSGYFHLHELIQIYPPEALEFLNGHY